MASTAKSVALRSPSGPGKEPRKTMTTMTLPDEVWEAFDRLQVVLGVPRSEILKRGVLLAIEHYEPAVKAMEKP